MTDGSWSDFGGDYTEPDRITIYVLTDDRGVLSCDIDRTPTRPISEVRAELVGEHDLSVGEYIIFELGTYMCPMMSKDLKHECKYDFRTRDVVIRSIIRANIEALQRSGDSA